MSDSKNLCFFTGKRGGFTHLIPILERIERTKDLKYSIIVSDMHLTKTFGNTLSEVRQWAKNIYRIETMLSSDSKVARAKSIGIGIINYAQSLDSIRPDLVFILGDRGEVLAFAISALELNIPIVHLFGGDITQGGVDEPIRHAITKLANIHFTSNQESANRILKMGEESWRIQNVGSPVLDLIQQKRFTPAKDIYKKFNLDRKKPIFLLVQHSVTWQVEQTEQQIRQTMEAIDYFGYQTIAVYPCSDPGYEVIIDIFSEYKKKQYFQLFKNIEFADFWGLMNISSLFIGNSSAGVMETASFNIPFLNIGMRQERRVRSSNVIDVDHNKNQIIKGIETALFENNFKKKVKNCISPYGDGKASERIVSFLRNLKINKKLIQKKMSY